MLTFDQALLPRHRNVRGQSVFAERFAPPPLSLQLCDVELARPDANCAGVVNYEAVVGSSRPWVRVFV